MPSAICCRSERCRRFSCTADMQAVTKKSGMIPQACTKCSGCHWFRSASFAGFKTRSSKISAGRSAIAIRIHDVISQSVAATLRHRQGIAYAGQKKPRSGRGRVLGGIVPTGGAGILPVALPIVGIVSRLAIHPEPIGVSPVVRNQPSAHRGPVPAEIPRRLRSPLLALCHDAHPIKSGLSTTKPDDHGPPIPWGSAPQSDPPRMRSRYRRDPHRSRAARRNVRGKPPRKTTATGARFGMLAGFGFGTGAARYS